jgi:hypothetical protein
MPLLIDIHYSLLLIRYIDYAITPFRHYDDDITPLSIDSYCHTLIRYTLAFITPLPLLRQLITLMPLPLMPHY